MPKLTRFIPGAKAMQRLKRTLYAVKVIVNRYELSRTTYAYHSKATEYVGKLVDQMKKELKTKEQQKAAEKGWAEARHMEELAKLEEEILELSQPNRGSDSDAEEIGAPLALEDGTPGDEGGSEDEEDLYESNRDPSESGIPAELNLDNLELILNFPDDKPGDGGIPAGASGIDAASAVASAGDSAAERQLVPSQGTEEGDSRSLDGEIPASQVSNASTFVANPDGSFGAVLPSMGDEAADQNEVNLRSEDINRNGSEDTDSRPSGLEGKESAHDIGVPSVSSAEPMMDASMTPTAERKNAAMISGDSAAETPEKAPEGSSTSQPQKRILEYFGVNMPKAKTTRTEGAL